MNEFELIAKLVPLLPSNPALLAGAGDDCAVLDLGLRDQVVLFKTDAVVQDVHFTPDTPARQVGRKALNRCLSDLAAMAGSPSSALITLALPKDFEVAWVEELYAGLREAALPWGVSISGGETVMNPAGLLISVAVLGLAPKHGYVTRSGARIGDALFVTGELGGSIAGKHLDFQPRLVEAQWLAKNFPVRAMIDLSDGLAGDLRHLLETSGAGAELLSRSIPISQAAKARGKENGKPPLLAALTDGEDFELLFAVPAGAAVALLDGWKARFPEIKLSCIGKIQAEPGIRLRDSEGVKSFGLHGYTHFS